MRTRKRAREVYPLVTEGSDSLKTPSKEITMRKRARNASPSVAESRGSSNTTLGQSLLEGGTDPYGSTDVEVMVRRSSIEPYVSCVLCRSVLRDATTIPECLHSFCRECIAEKFEHGNFKRCPKCEIDLGCDPFIKLRADHMLQSMRSSIFPVEKHKVEENAPPHPVELALLVSSSPQANKVDSSAEKTDASLVKHIASSPHTAVAPAAGPALLVPSADTGNRQRHSQLMVTPGVAADAGIAVRASAVSAVAAVSLDEVGPAPPEAGASVRATLPLSSAAMKAEQEADTRLDIAKTTEEVTNARSAVVTQLEKHMEECLGQLQQVEEALEKRCAALDSRTEDLTLREAELSQKQEQLNQEKTVAAQERELLVSHAKQLEEREARLREASETAALHDKQATNKIQEIQDVQARLQATRGSEAQELLGLLERMNTALESFGFKPVRAKGPVQDAGDVLPLISSFASQLEALDGLVQSCIEGEGRQLAEAVAEYVLACLRSRDPGVSLEAVRKGPLEEAEEAARKGVRELARLVAACFKRREE